MREPSADLLWYIQAQPNLHALAVEDADKAHQHPKVLAFAFEASLMAGQAQQNAITRKLAAWAAILAVPTAVAGIYGMNFQNMPELQWQYGYYVEIGVIAGLCGWLCFRFKCFGWVCRLLEGGERRRRYCQSLGSSRLHLSSCLRTSETSVEAALRRLLSQIPASWGPD